jgi:signal transduction histidine kinase
LTPKLPRFAENISFIKQNTSRLLRFITDLLDVARIEKGKLEITRKISSIEPLIHDTVKLFLERAKSLGTELVFNAPKENLPQIYLDGERISQVLANLISNALKYTPKGGKVNIAASVVKSPDSASHSSPAIRVSVQDTGSGIPQDALDKIFEKFYQLPDSRKNVMGPKGTGLGLSIAKSIVEAHGGRIFVESSSKGSRFSFELPI